MDLPQEYKVACFESKGERLTFKQVKLVRPAAGEVLVKVLACGVCHSDHGVQTALFGNGFPIVPGHEIVGDIVAVGEGEGLWKVGDRVGGAWHGGHDGICRSCKRGLYQICDHAQANGISRNGGYGEYVTLRSEATVLVPQDLDPAEVAPLLCAGVTVFNGIRKQSITPGSLVAVLGLGGLGHLALHSNSDVGEQLQTMGGAACVVLTAPSQKLISSLLRGLEPLGKLLILATAGPVEIDTTSLIQKGLSLGAWPSGHSLDCEEAIQFARIHGVHCMIEKYPLDKAPEAFDRMVRGEMRFRGVLIPT